MFKKGSKVEVLMGKDMPSGGWRVAEVVSGNGHTYGVRYGGSSGMGSGVNVGRVARKDIRPCPPLLDGQDSWNFGDLVEVFDDMSWKMAVILKVLGGNCCLIRLVGSSREIRLNNANIRVRQVWEGGTWSVLGKGCGNYDDMKSNKLSALSCYQKMSSPVTLTDAGTKVESEESCLAAEKNVSFRESCVVSARTLKRGSPFGLFEVETFERKSHKIRVIEKEGERQCYLSSCVNKVDTVACPQECLGETNMHTQPGFHESERGVPGCYVESFHASGIQPNDANRDACSVGSCSVISNSPCELYSHMLGGYNLNADILSTDAESSYDHGDEEASSSPIVGVDVAAIIHRLELHAYCCTLEALYASGPLSWEQEELLTNLRISLNISNDEHLMQLRNLISSSSRTSMHPS